MMTKITTTIARQRYRGGTQPHGTKSWAKHVTRIDPSKTNGYAFLGDWVDLDQSVQLPVNAVVLVFEGVNTKAEFFATIRVLQVTERGVAEIELVTTSDRGWALTVRPIIEGLLGPSESLYRVLLTAEQRDALSRVLESAGQELTESNSAALWLAQEALANAEEVR